MGNSQTFIAGFARQFVIGQEYLLDMNRAACHIFPATDLILSAYE